MERLTIRTVSFYPEERSYRAYVSKRVCDFIYYNAFHEYALCLQYGDPIDLENFILFNLNDYYSRRRLGQFINVLEFCLQSKKTRSFIRRMANAIRREAKELGFEPGVIFFDW